MSDRSLTGRLKTEAPLATGTLPDWAAPAITGPAIHLSTIAEPVPVAGEVPAHSPPSVDLRPGAAGHRFAVVVGGVSVAEIDVPAGQLASDLQLQVHIQDTSVTVLLTHQGDVSIIPTKLPAEFPYRIHVRELDLRRVQEAAEPPTHFDRFDDEELLEVPVVEMDDVPVLAASRVKPETALPVESPASDPELLPPRGLTEFEELQLNAPDGPDVLAILDPFDRRVIGYFKPGSVTKTLGRDGSLVHIDELALEAPAVDPIDLLVPSPTKAKGAVVGVKGIAASVGAIKPIGKQAFRAALLKRLARHELHHIATYIGYWGGIFDREFFRRAGLVAKTAKANKVLLWAHKGWHPEEYHMMIYLRLRAATDGITRKKEFREALIKELEEIAKDLTGKKPIFGGAQGWEIVHPSRLGW